MTFLFLNSLGTGEVLLIMFVVLMLFGSKGIPDFAKNIGKGMREIKTASNEIKRDIQNSALEMRKDLNLQNPLDEIKDLTKIELDLDSKAPPKTENTDLDSEDKTASA